MNKIYTFKKSHYLKIYSNFIINKIKKHLEENHNNLLARDTFLLKQYGAFKLFCNAVEEGGVVIHLREALKRKTKQELQELVKDIIVVAKTSNSYKTNKATYSEIE